MRHINRLAKPDVLTKKQKEWTDKFIDSGNPRPDNSKYANPNIKSSLYSASYHKCYYCERELKSVPSEIDHFIEISERKDLAFEWNNLYLSCSNCNDKESNISISVTNALDPCSMSDYIIQQHITYEDEQIKSNNNSDIGLLTIQKYKLDTILLDLLRLKELNNFRKLVCKLYEKKDSEGRNAFTEEEKAFIKKFANRDRLYSLMFKVIIDGMNLQ